MDDAATRRARRSEERLEQRLLDIEQRAQAGSLEEKAKAQREAHRYYRQLGQDLREVNLLLTDNGLTSDEHDSLEARKTQLLERIARVFKLINPN